MPTITESITESSTHSTSSVAEEHAVVPAVPAVPAVPPSVLAAAAAAAEAKDVSEKLEAIEKKIADALSQTRRAVSELYRKIDDGSEVDGQARAFGALEGDLAGVEDMEETLNELKSERSALTSKRYQLIRELRKARLEMRKVPFKELMRVVKSEKSTKEEYEAARKEITRREVKRLAVGLVMEGSYKVPNKNGAYSGYVYANSTAREVRNRPMIELAWLFKSEDAEIITAAVCELLGRPGSDGRDVSVTELCGLSEEYGLQFVGEREYWDLLVANKANVDAIIGTALKAKLRSIDPDHWDFCEDSEDSESSAYGAIAKRQRA